MRGVVLVLILACRPTVATAAATTPGKAPKVLAREAREYEEAGGYTRATATLRTLRGLQGPDADLELALALDEARTGETDSAAARLWGPLLSRALADSADVSRRHPYDWGRDLTWTNGGFDGWSWYVARARAELAAEQGRWSDARDAAVLCTEARPLAGKEWLILAVCAARAGDPATARDAAARAEALDPSLPEACYLDGLFEWKQGHRTEARAQFDRALALDSAWVLPAVARMRVRLPGTSPDSLPARFLYGAREAGLLTSVARPKLEDFIQMDRPAVILQRPLAPLPDSLSQGLEKLQLILPLLIDERGRVALHELPWYDPKRLPGPVVSLIIGALREWRFSPAMKLDHAQRVWASAQYSLNP